MSDPSAPHRIRLRGPWLRWSGTLEQFEQATRVTVPEPAPVAAAQANPAATEPVEDPAAMVFYRRAFNCPSGLTPATQLRLVLRAVPELAAVYLNERSLRFTATAPGQYRIPLPACLPGGNRLDLAFRPSDPLPLRLAGEVLLEIE